MSIVRPCAALLTLLVAGCATTEFDGAARLPPDLRRR